jgi:hypothetical protein
LVHASRGFAYLSKERAGDSKHWHGKCGCVIVCSWDKDNPNLPGYDPPALKKQYEYMESWDKARENERSSGFVEPDVKVGTAEDKANARKYWLERQNDIPLKVRSVDGKTVDVVLEPGEVKFAERFYMRGEDFVWIPQGQYDRSIGGRPRTYDVEWGGKEFELKSPNYLRSGIGAVHRDLTIKGKTSFIIDIGENVLEPKMLDEAHEFALGSGKLKELFVMSDGGKTLIKIT